MIDAVFYDQIYIWFVAVVTLFVIRLYRANDNTIAIESQGNTIVSFVILIIITMFIGMRPNNVVFGDSTNYVSWYQSIEGFPFYWDNDVSNPLFTNLLGYMASLRMGFNSFFIVIAAIYFGGIWFACYKLFPNNTLLAFVTYLGAFSTYSYSTNGIKAGVACSVFLIGMAFLKSRKFIPLVCFVLLSYYFHHSMVMCLAALLLVYFYNKNSKLYFIGWGLCLLISIFHITAFQEFFGGIIADNGDEHGAGYLLNNGLQDGWMTIGFRPDFVFYSSMPVIVGYYAKFKMKIKSKTYDFLLHLYLTLNGVWMLCMYASYTNRIAYLSWFLYPIVLIYPIISRDCAWQGSRGKILRIVVFCHLGFTLAMKYVYYVFFH